MHGNIIVALATFATAALAASGAEAQEHRPRADIVDTALSAGTFNTLAAALEAADLVDALKSRGPFTVFAPTDEAFAKLPEGTLETLLAPENKDQLISILTYHVVGSRVSASRVSKLNSAETLGGQRVAVRVENGNIKVDDATVVSADVRASNGVIHVIDEVLLPEELNIVEIAQKAGTFNTLVAAVEAAGLAGALSSDGPFTVFAPTDEAFAALPEGTVDELLAEEGLGTLQRILQYHVVEGRVFADEALEERRARTLARERVAFSVRGGSLRVNDAAVVATDIDASNGVIHVIDQVLLPEDIMVALASDMMRSSDPMSSRSGSASATDARDLIVLAIDRGVPLFNAGSASACAAIYEVATTALLDGYAISNAARRDLTRALRDARRTHDATERAWTLREGLDNALSRIDGRMATRH